MANKKTQKKVAKKRAARVQKAVAMVVQEGPCIRFTGLEVPGGIAEQLRRGGATVTTMGASTEIRFASAGAAATVFSQMFNIEAPFADFVNGLPDGVRWANEETRALGSSLQ